MIISLPVHTAEWDDRAVGEIPLSRSCQGSSVIRVAPILTYPAFTKAALFSVADRINPPLGIPPEVLVPRLAAAAPGASWLAVIELLANWLVPIAPLASFIPVM